MGKKHGGREKDNAKAPSSRFFVTAVEGWRAGEQQVVQIRAWPKTCPGLLGEDRPILETDGAFSGSGAGFAGWWRRRKRGLLFWEDGLQPVQLDE